MSSLPLPDLRRFLPLSVNFSLLPCTKQASTGVQVPRRGALVQPAVGAAQPRVPGLPEADPGVTRRGGNEGGEGAVEGAGSRQWFREATREKEGVRKRLDGCRCVENKYIFIQEYYRNISKTTQ